MLTVTPEATALTSSARYTVADINSDALAINCAVVVTMWSFLVREGRKEIWCRASVAVIAQIITMTAVFLVTWIGLAIIGIPSSFILGIQAGLLAFIPTVGAILGGLIVVLASLATGWIAALSAFILCLGVHALESYVLTPIIPRQALDIPPATLFAFQILLGVVFGIWGLALALPLMAIAKVMIDHFKADDPVPAKAV